MKAKLWISAIAILFVSSALFAAESNPIVVSHYEGLQRLSIQSSARNSDGSSQKVQHGTPIALTFDALGKTFDLRLEPNERFLSTESRNALPAGIEVYRGQLAGNPASWTRIVIYDGMPRGLVWDGTEMFAIEAPGDSVLQTTSPIIYRLADTLIMPGSMSCGSGPSFSNGATALQKLTMELGGIGAQASGAVAEIEMGAVGDFEFTNDKGDDAAAAAAITTRLNNVDGIFSQQVNVQIRVTLIETFSDATDPAYPFTTTLDSGTLLDELSAYRQATPAQNANGLTHLYTGKNLDTTTVGVAWSGALCSNFFGAGLSEGRGGAMSDSLIAAHEIGHNFGAPHDGQAGSACESELGAFIMAPQLNGSQNFSSCSIAEMQDDIAGASCISALPVVDMSVRLNNQSANVLLGASTSLTYDVASNGSSQATGVEVDITVPANLSLDSVTASAGTCMTLGSDINCVLGDVPGLSSRTVTVMTTPVTLGPGMLDATVSTVDADERPSNDTEVFLLTVDPAVDLLINTPTAADIDVDASTTIRAVLDNASILDATGVAVNVILSNGLQIDSASWSIGACTVTLQEIDCLAANFSAQSSSTLTVGVTGLTSGSKNFTVTLSSVEAEANPSDNIMDSSVRVISDKKDSGGATGPLFLLLLAGLAFVRVRRPRLAKL